MRPERWLLMGGISSTLLSVSLAPVRCVSHAAPDPAFACVRINAGQRDLLDATSIRQSTCGADGV